MLNKLKKIDNKGFTIIEVMIVLAIAGLILLIVFLAIPNLQRSQRNSARKSDAGHIGTAVTSFISNNQGTLPDTSAGGNWSTDCGTILSDAGSLNQYKTTAPTSFSCGSVSNGDLGKLDGTSGQQNTIGPVDGQGMVLDTNAQCPKTIGGQTTSSQSSTNTNQIALFYTTEPAPSQNHWNWSCLQVQ